MASDQSEYILSRFLNQLAYHSVFQLHFSPEIFPPKRNCHFRVNYEAPVTSSIFFSFPYETAVSRVTFSTNSKPPGSVLASLRNGSPNNVLPVNFVNHSAIYTNWIVRVFTWLKRRKVPKGIVNSSEKIIVYKLVKTKFRTCKIVKIKYIIMINWHNWSICPQKNDNFNKKLILTILSIVARYAVKLLSTNQAIVEFLLPLFKGEKYRK